MKNQVINVIEIKDGNADMHVNSWLLPHKDDTQHPYVRDAEELFAALLRAYLKANFSRYTADEIFELIESHIEDGSYIRADYKLFLTWSESVAQHD